MNDNNRPDYIGAWDCHDFSYLNPANNADNTFKLYIEGRHPNGAFKGKSLDKFGEAAIIGIESDDNFCFSKIYSLEAQRKGGSTHILNYLGTKAQGRGSPEERTNAELIAGTIIGENMPAKVFVMRKVD